MYKRRTYTPVGQRHRSPERALESLMRLCSRAEKSSGDAMRLMRTWGVDEAERPKVLEKLIEHKFIDDSRYAAAYVREKSRMNGWGPRKIRYQLTLKGVARDIADQALEQLADDPSQSEEKLDQMLAKKLRNTKEADMFKLRGKLFQYGMSLGYGYDQVIAAIARIDLKKVSKFVPHVPGY